MDRNSLNRVFLIGRLGADPEVRDFGNGGIKTVMRVATNEAWTNAQGEPQEKTLWHNVVAWGKLGEICSRYLKKGRQVFVEGRINYRQYEKDGQTLYFTEIIAQNIQFLDSQREAMGDFSPATQQRYTNNYPTGPNYQQPTYQQQSPPADNYGGMPQGPQSTQPSQPAQPPNMPPYPPDDDDIPF